MSYYQSQNVHAPQRRTLRQRAALVSVGFVALLVGVALGSAGASGSAEPSSCKTLTGEYAALVSEGLDAGLSGDETWMLDVAAQRDALSERVKNNC